jgi:hypothetical protein
MEIAEYITGTMANFVKEFPDTKLNYGFDKMANVHIIEVLPLSFYHSDAFKLWLWDFGPKSIELFPTEDIGFISEDAAVPLEKVDFSVTGVRYGLSRKTTLRSYAEAPTRNYMVCEGEIPYKAKE